jgi:hypothetical protein
MNTFVVQGVISCEREIPKHRSGYLLETSARAAAAPTAVLRLSQRKAMAVTSIEAWVSISIPSRCSCAEVT